MTHAEPPVTMPLMSAAAQWRAEFPGLNQGWVLFDNAGGSQILRSVVERMTAFLYGANVQIGGSYDLSVKAAESLAAGRAAMARLMNAARPEEIVFGPSATALFGNLARAMARQIAPGDEIIVTRTDHEANITPWLRLAEAAGAELRFWDPDPETLELDLADLDALLGPRTRLAAVTHVSNLLGVINPIAEIADRVHAAGAQLCVDGVAFAPHRRIDVQALGADYYVFSLYKCFGPHAAVMYGTYDRLLALDNLYHATYRKDQVPVKLEPGNASYECAYGSSAILDYIAGLGGGDLDAGWAAVTAQEAMLTDRALSCLTSRKDITVLGRTDPNDPERVPTVSFTAEGHSPEALCRAMDEHRIAMRHGHFHAPRLTQFAGRKDGGVARISLAHYNTVDEVDRFAAALDSILRE